ncbi:olfactory receptor 6N1-like [Ranitomeya variabilis]|uniref:olfactory receptor 6N1-like n=1 Tax=Ranitomeya variabilis TaxID=490064 RepID=UPI004055EF3D
MEENMYLQPSVLILGFRDVTSVRYFYSFVAFLVFTMVIFYNVMVIVTVLMHKTLQEPVYIFVSMPCLNGIDGSTTFLPFLVFNQMSSLKTITYVGCLKQVFCVHTYEMAILNVMAFDHYMCICNPLRYNNLMTLATVFKMVFSAWLFIIFLVGIHLVLTITLLLCDTTKLKVYCDNWSVVRLSCMDIAINNVYGLFIASTVTRPMPTLIVISYFQIFEGLYKVH